MLPALRYEAVVEPQSAARRPMWRAPWQDSQRLQASQIKAILAQLVHQARPLPIGPGKERRRGNDRTRLQKDIGADIGKSRAVLGERACVIDENGNVVIRVRSCRAACAGAEQHHALNALTVGVCHGGAEAKQNRVRLWVRPHDAASLSSKGAIENRRPSLKACQVAAGDPQSGLDLGLIQMMAPPSSPATLLATGPSQQATKERVPQLDYESRHRAYRIMVTIHRLRSGCRTNSPGAAFPASSTSMPDRPRLR